ncbi:hypothetical protein AGMMS4957_13120 [Bacteroidia bacterium]|nr:hypothetical protein AGMMS4957_13120 [Bacteroidia bacterium]
MKNAIILLLLSVSVSTYAQVKIVDAKTDEPVAFAHLVIDKGKFGAGSDVNGVVSLAELSDKMQNAVDTMITIRHLGYENFEIGYQTLKQLSIIQLTERDVILPEVEVTPVKQYDYVVLKGFYRSYHVEDNVLKYYTDGIVEYCISPNKSKMQFRLLEQRSFRNQDLIDKLKQKSIVVVEIMAKIPRIDGKTIQQELGKEYIFQPHENRIDILKKNQKVGFVQSDLNSDAASISVNTILPNQEEKFSIFGYTARMQKYERMEQFSISDINQIDVPHLESYMEHTRMYFSHKKDPAEALLEGTTEFYVTERQYLTKKELKGIKWKSDYSFPKSSSFSYEYWKDLEQYHIPASSSQIENELGKSLIPY